MEAKMEKVETNVVKFEVRVEATKFNEALNKAYKKNVNRFNVPGFRKGKVPMAMVKKYYGVEVLYDDAINSLIDSTYAEVLSENDIKPVDYPQIDIVEVGEGKDLVYTAKVTVYPEVELGEYKGVEVKKPVYNVEDEEIEKQVKAMAEKNARVETKEEGTVEEGNIAVIDFKGFVDDVAFEGGEGKDYSLEIGSHTFIDNFEEQLVGLKVGENKEVIVTFPENYGKEELNGKEAKFEVTVKEIKTKELPNLDDEFAKEVSEFDTIAELKEDIKAKLEKSNAEKEKREFEEAVVRTVVENAKIDLPEVMVDRELENMMKDLENKLKYQGLTLEQYYAFTGSNEESMKSYMRDGALNKVKTELVLEKVSKTENIDVTEEEIKTKAMEIAKMYSGGNEEEKMAEMIMQSQGALLKTDIINEKTVNFLIENCKVSE